MTLPDTPAIADEECAEGYTDGRRTDCPQRGRDGKWHIGDRAFDTNREAWRWLDLQENEFLNQREAAHNWSFRKSANGE